MKRPYDSTGRMLAGPCVDCQALLAKAKPPREQNTSSQRRGRIRYCKCHNCGVTWKLVLNSKGEWIKTR